MAKKLWTDMTEAEKRAQVDKEWKYARPEDDHHHSLGAGVGATEYWHGYTTFRGKRVKQWD